jgi:hypothetical protein
MPVFSDDPCTEDPELLRRLRAMLRGPEGRSSRLPTCEERFGVPSSGDAAPEPKEAELAVHAPSRDADRRP